jgi:hypothetical protein
MNMNALNINSGRNQNIIASKEICENNHPHHVEVV